MKRTEAADARWANDAILEQKQYANKAEWLVVGEWCTRRVAFYELGRALSTGRRRVEGVG